MFALSSASFVWAMASQQVAAGWHWHTQRQECRAPDLKVNHVSNVAKMRLTDRLWMFIDVNKSILYKFDRLYESYINVFLSKFLKVL